MASGALSRLGPLRHPGTARLLRFTSKNKHVPQAAPVPRGPAPASAAAAAQSRLCARPAAPAAQAILISVWVCAGRCESKPPFFQRPRPDPRLPPRVPGSAYPCRQPREVASSRSLRLGFESHRAQRRDRGALRTRCASVSSS